MYFPDLSSYSYYLKRPIDKVLNIGWLEEGESFTTGSVEVVFLSKLATIINGNDIVNLHVNRIRGIHPCALSNCDKLEVKIEGKIVSVGSSEIWIPSNTSDQYFASPSMVFHYIAVHDYLPPNEFISAVMSLDLKKYFNGQEVYLNVIKGHF